MGELVGAQLQQGIGESPQDSLAIVSAAAVDYGIIKKKTEEGWAAHLSRRPPALVEGPSCPHGHDPRGP